MNDFFAAIFFCDGFYGDQSGLIGHSICGDSE